ncbi:MAG: T9SS type A sorting domain-containing protein [candidate division KSB1 bacterium]|nr:T9SS type A sorting domain-containing protein [candidate division KSB1 bacterium]
MKPRSLWTAGLLVLLAVGMASAQTVHQVVSGEGTLLAAIQAAADGDTLELVDSGGLYTESSTEKLIVGKRLTIRAKSGLERRPVVRITKSDATSARLFEIAKGGSLTLIGLDLDGRMVDGGAPFAKNIVRTPSGLAELDSTFHCSLKIYDCLLHHTREALIKGYSKVFLDTVIVHNSILDEALYEAICLRESSTAGGPIVQYVDIENCTFTKIGREALYIEFSNPTVRINHCTFDSISCRENKRILYPVNVTDVQIRNSIFTNQLGTVGQSMKLYGNSSISYCDTFNVFPIALVDNATKGPGMLGVDPKYTNPAQKDYTLALDSPVLGMADDGRAMGDLRWEPRLAGPVVHPVVAGDGTLRAAMEAAADGDTLELVDSGGLYTESSTDRLVVDKKLTIRAKAGLERRPIVRITKSDATSARLFEIAKGGSLTLIGLDLDGRMVDGGAPFAKNIVRTPYGLPQVDSTFHCNLKIYDCVLHHTKEALIKGYSKVFLDTVIIHNSILDEAGYEAVCLRESTEAGGPIVQYVDIYNCTFTTIGREALYLQYSNPVVRINHCTFDSISIGSGQNKRIIYPVDVTDVQIKNSIFTRQKGGATESMKLYGSSTISYCDTFGVRPIGLVGGATKGPGMMGVDPKYANPAQKDYTLAPDSPVRGAADDGLAMGDLRWAVEFAKLRLTVEIQGQGTVLVDPPGYQYDPGTVVTLTAVPEQGWELARWIGNVQPGFPPNANPVTVIMDQDQTVVAVFRSTTPQVRLTVQTVGHGHVQVEPQPSESGTYDQGTVVTLTAIPDTATWRFVEWRGDISGTVNPISFALDSNMTVVAVFASVLPQFTLQVATVGMGTVVVTPPSVTGTYDSSQVVILRAQPALGWQFAGWAGDLTGAENPDTLVMDSNKNVTAVFSEIQLGVRRLEVDTTWDLRDAVEFANNNSTIDTLVLTVPGGLYTSRSTENVDVRAPLVIMAKPGLEQKPIVTNSDPEASNLDIFRVFDDFTLIGVIVDGGHPLSHGMKYGIRMRHYEGGDSVRPGANVTVIDCEFRNLYERKDPNADGHAFKIDVGVRAGTVRFENCTFQNIGYEALRISDTEKWATDRALDTLIVRNCTFVNIDAEAVRYYSDANPATPDPPVILEHLTFYNTATRVIYLKNSSGAVVRDLIIAKSRTSGHGRDDDLIEAQGAGTVVSHIDTFRVKRVPIEAPKGGYVDTTTIWGFDPMFADPDHGDFTLLPGSPLYGLAHDGTALGDLRWATNPPVGVQASARELPTTYVLWQNYPNPFNPVTTIRFDLPKAGHTTLKLYDTRGSLIATILDADLGAGSHEVKLNGSSLASGIYVYVLRSGDFTAARKLVLMK